MRRPAGIYGCCHRAHGIQGILRSTLLGSSTRTDLFFDCTSVFPEQNRLENKSSIPLRAQLGAGRALQGSGGGKAGPKVTKVPEAAKRAVDILQAADSVLDLNGDI